MGKKSKNQKAGGDFWDEEETEVDTTPQEFGVTSESTEAAPEEANEEANEEVNGASAPVAATADDEWGDDFMANLRKSKQKKEQKQKDAEADKAVATGGPVQVKSKKEKEREKKEREKAKKKAQAERKKTAPPPINKKQEKKQQQQEQEPTPEVTPEPEEATAKAGKGKKMSAQAKALEKLKKQIAADKARKEEEEQERQAELARLEEERKREEEEERLREEARLAKKEKERKKREELRAQGKLLTKKQKEQQALQERRRQQLLASGVVVEGLEGGAKKQKPVYGKKKPSKKEEQESKEASPEPQQEATPEPEKVPEPAPEEKKDEVEEEVIDDWEAALDSEGEVKDDWEAELDEEEEEEAKPAVEEKKEVKPAPKKEAPKKKEEAKKEEEESVLEKGTIMTAERKAELSTKREERRKGALAKASDKDLRSPICCILGHVDAGKTKLLDKVRQTNVQGGEAGGITQQIGATYFPIDAIEKKTKVMDKYVKPTYNVPGLLIIDTPGHEAFTSLRSRGSSLCNIAILVVDIMHGLEPQTLESIRLLRERKTPFVVALNKVDRLYSWEATPNNAFRDSFAKQNSSVQREFEDRLEKTKVAFAEQGLNAELYFKNKNLGRTVSIVPTSATTGEGIPDLLYLLLELTQSRMSKELMFLSDLEATVLDAKVEQGIGATIDVILSNGVLKEGDKIVLCGRSGPIVTHVRALLTPQPLREMRLKSEYIHHKQIKAAMGVKIVANDLYDAIAGSRLLVVGPDDDVEDMMDDVMDDLSGLLDNIDRSGSGVAVQASSVGSMEALLTELKKVGVPVMSIGLGTVFRRDVMRATTMLERNKEYAVMLCFDVHIDKEAQQYADENGIKIFTADVIYHLTDAFENYQKGILEQRRKDNINEAVFPCVLNIIQVINKRNPMIIGVDVVEGSLRIGTPIAIVKVDPVTKQKVTYPLGRVISLEVNHKSVEVSRKGDTNAGVAMRLEAGSASLPTWGRHIDEKDTMYSLISRKTIDTLKDPAFRKDVKDTDWRLLIKLKGVFDIK
ncbi:eukaryotic translation initiation factor 5B [Trichomonascus vanleenenianus]|uniref:translation initiation factor eIF5B n=1 Tax=Trichomonascus vanleenenianus TaxID=2268995 RepID=UPI003ECA4EDC